MVDTHDEKKEMEELKQLDKIELIELNAKMAKEEHAMKLERLQLMLKIAEAGGVKMGVE